MVSGCSCLWLWICSLDLECSSPSYLAVLHFPQIMVMCCFSRRSLLWPSHWNYNPSTPTQNHTCSLPPFYTLFFSWHCNSLIWYMCICLYLFIHSFSTTFQEFRLSYSLWCPSPTKWSLAPCWYSANTDSGILQVYWKFVHFPSLQFHPCLPNVWCIKELCAIKPVKNGLSSQTSV